MQEIYEFYKKYNELQTVLRKGWLMRNVPVKRHEDDAHHTLQTILLADLIIRYKNIPDLDILKILEMLLIHDIGETIIGDVAMIESDYEQKKQNERDAVKEQLACLGEELGTYYFNLWVEFETESSREARFAKVIDKLDAVMKAKQYDQEFNTDKYFKDFYPHALGVLSENEFLDIVKLAGM